VALAFVASVSAGVVRADAPTIPRYFEFRYGRELLWISATEAITAEGTLRPDVPRAAHLDHSIARWKEQHAGPQPCDITFGHSFTEGPDDGVIQSVEVLDEVVATRTVIDGTVSASTVGMHDGQPYMILQIDVPSKNGRSEPVYLMYPKGRLQFEGITFCKDDELFSGLPAAGDPIVFITSYPLDARGTLYQTTWVVYEHDGQVVGSAQLELEAEARPRSVREFAARLRASQHRQKQR
jgi:hypothetical protein